MEKQTRLRAWLARRRGGASAVDTALAPLVDVLFLLLIFVLISASFDRQRVLEVSLPNVSNAAEVSAADQRQQRVLEVAADGALRWQRRPIKLKPLCDLLREEPLENQLIPILIQADFRADWGLVAQILTQLRQLGFHNYACEVLVTDGPGALPK